jgi:MYXO-CTERM domain-containing protein
VTTHIRRSRQALAVVAGAVLAIGSVGGALAGGIPDIEAGIYTDFTAPDAGTSTPGAITFGLTGTPEVIAADATLVPPADTNLSFLAGSAPTCLEVTREGGAITQLAFVETCTVSGPVVLVPDVFSSGTDGYITDDRIATPADIVLGVPGINALMKTTADNGGSLTVTFTVDVSVGVPTAFSAFTDLDGAVELLPGGDIRVGAATLLSAVIDPASRALLEDAAENGLEATVHVAGEGVIDTSGESAPTVEITLAVTVATPAPTPTPTPPAAELPDTSVDGPATDPTVAMLVLLAAAVGISAWRRRANPLEADRRE